MAWAVTTAAASLEFDTDINRWNSCAQIDSNHFINFWMSTGLDGFVQTFTVNTTTWAVTTAAASLEFDTVTGVYNSCVQIDSNHFLNFWNGFNGASSVSSFVVDTSTWAVTTAAALLSYNGTAAADYNFCGKVDTNHFINFAQGAADDGFARVFTVNTTTWAVTTATTSGLEFDTQDDLWNSCAQIDENHFINFWNGPTGDGFVQTFAIDTSTWVVTTAAASLEFDTQDGTHNSCKKIDANHFINFWGGPGQDGYAQVFTVNTTTWAVTTAANSLEFDTTNGTFNSCFQIDTTHFINFFAGETTNGYAQVFAVSTTTWAVSTAGAALEFDTQANGYNSCFQIDSTHFINFWSGPGEDGFVQVFTVDIPAYEAVSGTNIFSDTFNVDAEDGTLASHAPDVGTSWTIFGTTGNALSKLYAELDVCFSDGTAGLNDGVRYTADCTYTGADYQAEIQISGAVTTDTDTYLLFLRVTDDNNWYALRFNNGHHTIFKNVAGTPSTVSADDTTFVLAVGDRVRFQIVGTTIKTFINDYLFKSVTDSSLSSTGKAGYGIGASPAATGDDVDVQEITNFNVYDLTVAASGAVQDTIGTGIVPFAR